MSRELRDTPKSHAIKFGRWLLKYCFMEIDKEGYICYMYEGKLYNTDELYDVFLEVAS